MLSIHEFGLFHLISKMEVIVVSSCGKEVIKRVIPFIHSALQMIPSIRQPCAFIV